MAERFGTQVHPSGGLRFGSQTYAALGGVVVGDFAGAEAGGDVFAADSYPRVSGELAVSESGSDVFVASGVSSLLFTMQAYESPTPDQFNAQGVRVAGSLRFGAQEHPAGGLRFGSQAWAALGPNGSMLAIESGSDALAAAGFQIDAAPYAFRIFDVLASFVDYGPESLAAAIVGTLDDGYKVMLPVSAGDGISFEWEVSELGHPSLRLAGVTGAHIISEVPWYVWDGSSWTAATFDVSDAMQGAAFLAESGADTFIGNGSQTRYGAATLVEDSAADFVDVRGGVSVRGSPSLTELGGDAFAASGAPSYVGRAALHESSADDVLVGEGTIEVSGSIAAADSATGDAFTGAGSLAETGDLAAIETGEDVFASVARLSSTGALSATESAAEDVAAGSGAVLVSGPSVWAESGQDVFAAAGFVERLGVVALVEAGDDASGITGRVALSGALSAIDQPDVFTSSGTREATGNAVVVEIDALEGGSDRFVARGFIGNPPPIITFDGPINASSSTRTIRIYSRRTAEAA
jgi:hypothetical protein